MNKKLCKKGFTASEVMVVMVAIGVIATLTVFNTMRNITKQQKISALKLAYKTIETSVGTIASNIYYDGYASETKAQKVWKALNDYVVPQGYYCSSYTVKSIVPNSKLKPAMSWGGGSETMTTVGVGNPIECGSTNSPWIVLNNGIAYTVDAITSDSSETGSLKMSCDSVLEINQKTSYKDVIQGSCAQIIVDINGLNKGPNKGIAKDTRGENLEYKLDDKANVDELLEYDRFRIFVGDDGVTPGPNLHTDTAMIMNDEK